MRLVPTTTAARMRGSIATLFSAAAGEATRVALMIRSRSGQLFFKVFAAAVLTGESAAASRIRNDQFGNAAAIVAFIIK